MTKKGNIPYNLKDIHIFKFPFILLVLFAMSIGISYTLSQILFYLMLLIFFICMMTKKIDCFPPNCYNLFFILYAVSMLISIMFALDIMSSMGSFRIILQMLVVFVVCGYDIDIRGRSILFIAFVFACMVSSVYAIGQKIGGVERVSGFFGDFQTLSGVLSIAVLILFSYLINSSRGIAAVNIIYTVCISLMFIALYFTYTRSALLGLIFGMLVIFFYKAKWSLYIFGSIILLLIGIALMFPKSEMGDLVLSVIFPKDRASSRFMVNRDRIDMYGDSLKIIREFPMTGIGHGNLQALYREGGMDLAASKNYTRISSNYFNVLVSSGIIGITAFVMHLLSIGFLLIKYTALCEDNDIKPLFIGTLSSFVFFLIAGLFEPVFFDPKVRFVMYFFIGLCFTCYAQRKPYISDTG